MKGKAPAVAAGPGGGSNPIAVSPWRQRERLEDIRKFLAARPRKTDDSPRINSPNGTAPTVVSPVPPLAPYCQDDLRPTLPGSSHRDPSAPPAEALSIAFAPDGHRIAIAGRIRTKRGENPAGGGGLLGLMEPYKGTLRILNATPNPTLAVAFAPDGKTFAVGLSAQGAKDLEGGERHAYETAALYDATSYRPIRFLVHADDVNAVAYSPDGAVPGDGLRGRARLRLRGRFGPFDGQGRRQRPARRGELPGHRGRLRPRRPQALRLDPRRRRRALDLLPKPEDSARLRLPDHRQARRMRRVLARRRGPGHRGRRRVDHPLGCPHRQAVGDPPEAGCGGGRGPRLLAGRPSAGLHRRVRRSGPRALRGGEPMGRRLSCPSRHPRRPDPQDHLDRLRPRRKVHCRREPGRGDQPLAGADARGPDRGAQTSSSRPPPCRRSAATPSRAELPALPRAARRPGEPVRPTPDTPGADPFARPEVATQPTPRAVSPRRAPRRRPARPLRADRAAGRCGRARRRPPRAARRGQARGRGRGLGRARPGGLARRKDVRHRLGGRRRPHPRRRLAAGHPRVEGALGAGRRRRVWTRRQDDRLGRQHQGRAGRGLPLGHGLRQAAQRPGPPRGSPSRWRWPSHPTAGPSPSASRTARSDCTDPPTRRRSRR